MEYLDIFSEEGEQQGIASREEVHRKGLWHQTFHCWIVQAPGNLLFQRRCTDKDVYPGKLDITAAGHLLAGEGPETGVRELEEELGISTAFEDLISLGIRRETFAVDGFLNKEFCHTFMLRWDQPLEDYVFPDGEVAGLVQLPFEGGKRLFVGEIEALAVKRLLIEENGQKQIVRTPVKREDFIPRDRAYYLEVLKQAERVLG